MIKIGNSPLLSLGSEVIMKTGMLAHFLWEIATWVSIIAL